MTEPHELLKRITIIPGIMGGKPTIRGMRFKVSDVLGYLSSGMSEEQVLHDFPYLESDDIHAALLYAGNKLDHPIITVNLDAA
jgi:uncharacterized protein (DUF433 family)